MRDLATARSAYKDFGGEYLADAYIAALEELLTSRGDLNDALMAEVVRLDARVAELETDPRMKLAAEDILQTANACWASLYGETIGDDPTAAILRIREVLSDVRYG